MFLAGHSKVASLARMAVHMAASSRTRMASSITMLASWRCRAEHDGNVESERDGQGNAEDGAEQEGDAASEGGAVVDCDVDHCGGGDAVLLPVVTLSGDGA